MSEQPGRLTLADLAAYWQMSEEAIKRLVRAGEIPFVVLGKSDRARINWERVRFKKDAIDQWEDDHNMTYSSHVGGGKEKKPAKKDLLKGGWHP